MRTRRILTGAVACSLVFCSITAVHAEGDIWAEAQQMYDDAYAQAMEEYDQAFQQAQEEYNNAYEQAQKEIGSILGGSSESGSEGDSQESNAPSTGKIKNYVGRNVASFGYTSLGGDRLDDGYGKTLDTLKLALVADDGSFIDIEDDGALKQYVVIAQNIEPDSDIVFTYDQYGFTENQTYVEIELLCKKVSEDTANPVLKELTKINPSPDKSTQYVKDYVGRNLASVGYTGLDEMWHDEYNGSFNTVDIVVITDDGSYIEPDDKDTQKQYVVTSQNPPANSEFLFNYNEYGFTDSQTYSEIELHVSRIS